MENVLIHIGYHKTGTTWLQNELFITGDPCFEPVSLHDRGHSTLAHHFIYDKNNYLLSSFDLNEEVISRELSSILKKRPDLKLKVPVISHERLSGNPHSSGFDSRLIALRLKNYFPKAKILIVIREQKSFIQSNYSQYLSIGGTHDLQTYLNVKYDGKRPFFSPNHINYLPLIEEYYNLFEKDNVLVLPYEMFKAEPDLFFSNMGIFLNTSLSVPTNKVKIVHNSKEYYWTLYHFRFLNKFIHKSSVNDYSNLANKTTSSLALQIFDLITKINTDDLDRKTKSRHKDIINNRFRNIYSDSNRQLSELINIDLSKYGYF